MDRLLPLREMAIPPSTETRRSWQRCSHWNEPPRALKVAGLRAQEKAGKSHRERELRALSRGWIGSASKVTIGTPEVISSGTDSGDTEVRLSRPRSTKKLFLCYNIAADSGRALNSAVECHLHTVEVIGSNPIAPTSNQLVLRKLRSVPFPLASIRPLRGSLVPCCPSRPKHRGDRTARDGECRSESVQQEPRDSYRLPDL